MDKVDNLRKSAHKVFKIKYHFVFCIKYRKDLFVDDKYTDFLRETCLGIEERYSIVFETMGFDDDHVHFMIQTFPRFCPSDVFRIVKSITAKKLFEKFPDIKKDLWGGQFWSDGGYVGTVGEGINGEIIRNYIRNQGRKIGQLRLLDF